jgi:predicted metal-dependent enzyme (double-stranded beta helix superfamily)
MATPLGGGGDARLFMPIDRPAYGLRQQERKADMYNVEQFIEEAEAIVRQGYTTGSVAAIKERLRRLAAESDVLAKGNLTGLHGAAAQAEVLGRGPDGSVLMLARFSADAPTPVHNHNSWGVAYVVKGRDRYERWRRVDDGTDPERAEVELIEALELGPGEATSFPPPPQDLHAQQGIGNVVWELVFFAADPDRQSRAYFDPEIGKVTYQKALG